MSCLTAARSRRLERLGVVEVLAERVGHGGVLGEDLQVEPVGPPAPVAAALRSGAGRDRARPGSRLRSSRLVHLADFGVGLLGVRQGSSFRISGSRTAAAAGAQAPVDDLGLVDRRSRGRRTRSGTARRRRRSRRRRWRRTSGTRRGDGCRRPATRSAPPSRDGWMRRTQARVGQRLQHVVDGLLGHLAELLAHAPMIEYVSACGWSYTAASTATRGRVTRREAPRSMPSSSATGGMPAVWHRFWKRSRLAAHSWNRPGALLWRGQTARATRGRDLQLNVPFPRKPPDLLMAESPPPGGLSALTGPCRIRAGCRSASP